jgi:hypothetical protein
MNGPAAPSEGRGFFLHSPLRVLQQLRFFIVRHPEYMINLRTLQVDNEDK